MSVIINSNTAASIASNNLSASHDMLQKSLNRLSSGSKIINGSDDAGGVGVANRLSAAAKRSGVAQANLGNALSYLQNQDSGLKTMGKMLERMSELSALNKDTTKSTTDLALYSTEFDALGDAIDVIIATTVNTKALFTGTGLVINTNDAGGSVSLAASTVSTMGAVAIADTGSLVQTAIAQNAALRSTNGSDQSVLGYYSELAVATKTNFEAAISKIVDVDVAEESTKLARYNTLVQAGTAMIAQANGSTQSAIQLLRQ